MREREREKKTGERERERERERETGREKTGREKKKQVGKTVIGPLIELRLPKSTNPLNKAPKPFKITNFVSIEGKYAYYISYRHDRKKIGVGHTKDRGCLPCSLFFQILDK